MTTNNNFSERLDMEFGLMPIAIEEQRALLEREYHDRQKRFETSLVPALAQLRLIWEPRRDALLARFKDTIHIQPVAQHPFGKVAFSIDSTLARINLRFTFSHDSDVRNIILQYELEIVPILMKFDNHSTLKKRKLALRQWAYIQNYADAKTDIIEEIMAKAGSDRG
jgi:hypothetical protein